jgi:hypothetical protein
MRRQPPNKILKRLFLLLAGLLWGVAATMGIAAQTPPVGTITITAVDDSTFPTVRINLLTRAADGAPIPDLSGLSLRENGIPVAFDLATTTAGLDVVFIVDANATMLDVDDDSGQTRWQKVQAGLSRFATEFMDVAGGDLVSIIVPEDGGENGRFLIQNASEPTAVAEAMQDLLPQLVSPTPLNEMVVLGLEHLAGQRDDGRFQAILLLTDAGQIHQQLPFVELAQQANAANLPIYVAILGARADPDELFRANQLAEPTWATTIHAPQPESLDAIFALWAQQRTPPQIVYQSLQRQSGEYPLTLNLGEVRAATTWQLLLLPPEVVAPPLEAIVRQGESYDAPLAELQPTHQTLSVTISWPDGKARRLPVVAWTVNGRLQVAPDSLIPDDEGQLRLDWDLRPLGEGVYTHIVQVTDELGFTAASEPLLVQVVEERPLPPTPTPEPTAVPSPVTTRAIPTALPDSVAALSWLWPALLSLLALAALLLVLARRRRRQTTSTFEEPPLLAIDESPAPAPIALVALLEPATGRPIILQGDNISLGRDGSAADVVLDDALVSRLHARIVQQNGRYWLYDEGSAAGTFHNFRQVGLSPQALQDGDQIGLGRVQLRFRLRPTSELLEEEA